VRGLGCGVWERLAHGRALAKYAVHLLVSERARDGVRAPVALALWEVWIVEFRV
jgi:hypothetical protein